MLELFKNIQRISIVLCCLFIGQSAFSYSFSVSEAGVFAKNWVSERFGGETVVVAVEAYSGNTADMYIVHLDNAWVLLHKTSSQNPVVAYGEGDFELNQFSEPILDNIKKPSDEGYFSFKHYLTDDFVAREKKRAAVAPMLETQWGQLAPYNLMCPEDEEAENGFVPTGCGATALAQLMAFWKYPAVGYGKHSYSAGVYGQQSADFSSSEYNWTDMTANDLAKIHYHAGVSVDMDYGTTGSASTMTDLMTALKTYFGYSYKMRIERKLNFSDAEWEQMIKDELNAGRPLLYRGDDAGVNGHIWIVDGYDDQSFFHMNWGWDGDFNGYFDLDQLVTDGHEYGDHPAILFNIFPDENPVIKPNLVFESDTAPRLWSPSEDVENLTEFDQIYIYDFMYNNGRLDVGEVKVDLILEGPESKTVSGYTESLAVDELPVLNAYYLGMLQAGDYTLTLVADPDNVVDEIDETDNEFVLTFTVHAGGERAELSLIEHPEWHGSYLLNNKAVEGWNNSFSSTDDIYAFLAIGNVGELDVESPFSYSVSLDGKTVYVGEIESLTKNSFEETPAILLGSDLIAGEHTIAFIIDSNDDVKEQNEANSYYITFTVQGDSYANLTSFQPDGWDAPLVISKSKNDVQPMEFANAGESFFILYELQNIGGAAIDTPFEVNVSVGAMKYSPIEISSMSALDDILLYFELSLDAGEYLVTVDIDTQNDVAESDEDDNVYTSTIIVKDKEVPVFSLPIGPEVVCAVDTIEVSSPVEDGYVVSWQMVPAEYSSLYRYDDGAVSKVVFTLNSGYSGDVEITALYTDQQTEETFSSEALEVSVNPLIASPSVQLKTKYICGEFEMNVDDDRNIVWSNGMEGNNLTVSDPDVYKVKAVDGLGCESDWIDAYELLVFDDSPLNVESKYLACGNEAVPIELSEAVADLLEWYSEDSGHELLFSGFSVEFPIGDYSYSYSKDNCTSSVYEFSVQEEKPTLSDQEQLSDILLCGTLTYTLPELTSGKLFWTDGVSQSRTFEGASEYGYYKEENGCISDTYFVSVTVEELPNSVVIQEAEGLLSVSLEVDSIVWYKNDNLYATDVLQVDADEPAVYRYFAELTNGCLVQSELEYKPAVSVIESSIMISPIPAQDHIQISVSRDCKYELYSASMTKFDSGFLTASKNYIDLSQLSDGLYWIYFNFGENYAYKKIVVQK